jgi:hypothetical protein
MLFLSRGASKGRADIELEDYITLTVPGLKTRLGNDKKTTDDLRLFIDNLALPGVKPQVDLATGKATFHLLRDSLTERFWQIFYRIPRKYEHPARFSIGYADQQIAKPFPIAASFPLKQEPGLRLGLVREKWLYVGLLLTTLLWGFVIYRSTRNHLLRASWSEIPMGVSAVSKPPFSLAKVQLVYWLLLIASAYLMCYFVTGALPWLNASILALLGLGITGSWAGKLIDLRQHQLVNKRHQDVPSQGFWTDILTDENGASVARLQFVVFNLIIGFSFLRDVVKYWRLPAFDLQTMVLLTISGAGFLALKNQENSAPAPTQAPAAAAAAAAGAALAGGAAGSLATAPGAPAITPPMLADGTPIRRDDEDDNSAPPTSLAAALAAPPVSIRGMG